METNLEEIPTIGFGTWENTDPEQCAYSVKTAIDLGYRHIDTAQFYDNERAVGRGIAESEVEREELFVATKVWFKNLTYDKVLSSTEESLEKLGLDYLDCLYIHWPAGPYDPDETLPAFEKLVEEKIVRNFAVSNFTVELIEEAADFLTIPIFANQVEMHPLHQQKEMREYLVENNMKLSAYSPFRHGTIFDNPTLNEIADKHEVSVARICLAWMRNLEGVYPIPKATGREHIEDNFGARKLDLPPADREKINSLDRQDRYVDPPFAPWH